MSGSQRQVEALTHEMATNILELTVVVLLRNMVNQANWQCHVVFYHNNAAHQHLVFSQSQQKIALIH